MYNGIDGEIGIESEFNKLYRETNIETTKLDFIQAFEIEANNELINTLNKLLKLKERKVLKYESICPTALVIRNASPIFGMSDFIRDKELIYKASVYKSVWFISKDIKL
ncbi:MULTISPECIES: hypothetical protein [Paenibacillus]|uniref:hypothetical protein n=1 Tax=Paenibacillus TaxID=44249 RepID=UPI000695E7AF|nr:MULTISPECIES: hypothetical protein [Paenibacillus]AUS27804.1 hypothetical protein C1A50_3640 [Paenibacillus polymyxa]KAF6585955.1 hypothetical protein G9G57_04455 [Paenibacillus sp. EKM211P]RFT99005.1 hypothetical protein DX902_07350 [Paenibacillus jamilae]WOZ37095.1 hypothetical protein RQP19_17200 [Paenibacillus polymyxa]